MSDDAAQPLCKSRDFMSSTSTLRGPPSSLENCSSESSMPSATDSGSDCTDFTPWEFDAHPLPQHSSTELIRASASSDTLRTTGDTSPARDIRYCPREVNASTSPLRQRETSGNCEEQPTVTKKDDPSTSPADSRKIHNRVGSLLEAHSAAMKRKNHGGYQQKTSSSVFSASADGVRMERGRVVDLVAPLVTKCSASATAKNCDSSSKLTPTHPPVVSKNCRLISADIDGVRLHLTPERDTSTSRNSKHEVPSKHRRKLKDDRASASAIEVGNAIHRRVNLTAPVATGWEASEKRSDSYETSFKQPLIAMVTSPADFSCEDGRSTDFGTPVVARHDGLARRNKEREMIAPNNEGHHANLSAKHPGVTQRRRPSRDNPVFRDEAFYRSCNATAEAYESGHSAGIERRSPTANNTKVPRQEFIPAEAKDSRPAVDAAISKTSAEEERRKARVAWMKRYCLDQLDLPSKSKQEVARRRIGKRQRTVAAEEPSSPDDVHASKSGTQQNASVARRDAERSSSKDRDRPRAGISNNSHATVVGYANHPPNEYASLNGNAHLSYSTKPHCHISPLINHTDNANEMSLKISITEKTQHHQPLSNDLCDDKRCGSHASDRSKNRVDSERRRSPASRDRDRQSMTDCSPVGGGGRGGPSSRAGRLSVTISNSCSPEPEVHRTINANRMIVSSASDHMTYSHLNMLLTDRKLGAARRESSPSVDSEDDDDEKSSSTSLSSDVTINGSEQTTSTRSIQVQTEELRHPPTSEAKRQSVSSCANMSVIASSQDDDYARTPSTDCDGTTTAQSPCLDYFRRSGKDVWRASLALHRSSHHSGGGSTGMESGQRSVNSERPSADKSSRRKRPTVHGQHDEHLLSTSQDNVERAEIRQTTDSSRQNEATQIGTDERRFAADDRSQLLGRTSDLLQHGQRAAGHERLEQLKVQHSTSPIQLLATSIDASLTDAAVQDRPQKREERSNIVNTETQETLEEKQPAYDVTENGRFVKMWQRNSTEAAQNTQTQMKTTTDNSRPTETCRQTNELPDTATNSLTAVSVTPSHSEPSALNTPLVEVVVNGQSTLARHLDVVDEQTTPATEVLGTAWQGHVSNKVELPAYKHDRSNAARTRRTSREPTDSCSVNGLRKKVEETKDASMTMANHCQEVHPNGTYMTSAETGRRREPSNTALGIASFFARIIRWTS